MISETIIPTPRLALRLFRPEDGDAMHAVFGDPHVMKFSLSGPYSREQTDNFIHNRLRDTERKTSGLLAIFHRSTELVIGYCGFYHPIIDRIQEVELSYRLNRSYWGQGLATEASAAVRDFGFYSCGYARLISCIEEENAASIQVAEKNGMRHEKNALFSGVPVRIYSIARPASAIPGRYEKDTHSA